MTRFVELILKRNPIDAIQAVATNAQGIETWRGSAKTTRAAMALADQQAPKAASVTIRSDRTSDGTVWGPGRGRLLASRSRGKWLVE